jgi:hypothetical protein
MDRRDDDLVETDLVSQRIEPMKEERSRQG